MTTWVAVFLGVIALGALLQAAFLIGLAVASRVAHRRVREIEERLEPQLAAGRDNLVRLTAAVSVASEQVRRRALRLDVTAARLADDLGDMVGGGADRVQEMAEDTAERIAVRVAAPSEATRRPFHRALALLKGLRRGMAVWRGQDDGP